MNVEYHGTVWASPQALEVTVKLQAISRLLFMSVVFILALGAPGCARRSVEAPPEPAPAPSAMTTTPVEVAEPVIEEPPPAAEAPDMVPAYFAFDSSILSESAREALDQAARILRDRPEVVVTIEGHCDERGASEYNMALGEKRAAAARAYLVAAGVPGDRIVTISYGEERPFDEGHDETAWARNRQAHFVARLTAPVGSSTTYDAK